jgi:hypothetical protein
MATKYKIVKITEAKAWDVMAWDESEQMWVWDARFNRRKDAAEYLARKVG